MTMSYNNRNRWSITKQSHFMRRENRRKHKYVRFGKVYRPKEQLIKFPSFSLLGGNRRDPLNLNELIQKKKQLTTNNIQNNDRQVEIYYLLLIVFNNK